MQDLTNWEGFRRTKRQKCWRAFPCSDLAASGILPWPASTLQVGLHIMHIMHSPRCIQQMLLLYHVLIGSSADCACLWSMLVWHELSLVCSMQPTHCLQTLAFVAQVPCMHSPPERQTVLRRATFTYHDICDAVVNTLICLMQQHCNWARLD